MALCISRKLYLSTANLICYVLFFLRSMRSCPGGGCSLTMTWLKFKAVLFKGIKLCLAEDNMSTSLKELTGTPPLEVSNKKRENSLKLFKYVEFKSKFEVFVDAQGNKSFSIFCNLNLLEVNNIASCSLMHLYNDEVWI